MSIEGRYGNPRAPAERNVLSKIGGYGRTGDWMRRGWVSQPVGLGFQAPRLRTQMKHHA